jgi:maltose alpha-D-glucosyltransferase/alpha-amylase
MSLPGSPVLYYGDEIGMGDNIYLGDRDGVRTPMQWSPDRNGGFSIADPASLYLPTITDPVYGFQALNVEAERRQQNSLINWTQKMIAARKRHEAFGLGTYLEVPGSNMATFSFVRQWEHDIMLCVYNLSQFPQPTTLDLSEWEGRVPVETMGKVPFPVITKDPYVLTLGPHNFYWLRLALDIA